MLFNAVRFVSVQTMKNLRGVGVAFDQKNCCKQPQIPNQII